MRDTTKVQTKLRVPFGEYEGKMYPPEQVARGLGCQCVCPGCGSSLISNQGERKRAYFSHYRSPECPGGYESALHKMAKQIILEKSAITLPPHAVPLEVTLIDGSPLRGKARFGPHRSELTSLHAEKNVASWRPDLIAELKNGASVHIEIGVTHFVEENKAAGLDNVMEIDLSRIAPETARDIDALREAVIESAPRRWYRVSLYDDLGRVHRKRRELEAKAAKHNAWIQRDKRRKHDKAQQKALETEEQRRRYAEHIDMLRQMAEPEAQNQLRESRREQWSETIEKWRDDITGFCAWRGLPVECVGTPLEGDWVVQAHPIVWQFRILRRSLTNHKYHMVQEDVEFIHSLFGFDPLMVELSSAIKPPSWRNRQGRAKAPTDFLSPREREALKTPHDLVRQFYRVLVSSGYLEKVPGGHDYQVVSKEERERRQRQEQADKQRKMELQQLVSSTQHRRYCDNMLESFLSKGVRHVQECARCWALTWKGQDKCPRCSYGQLAGVELHYAFVEHYRDKLATLPQ